jgi:hypothetical protein
MLNRGLRVVARSGAETGGGTTAASIDCIGAAEGWRLIEAGAGGTTFVASAGLDRKGSRDTFGAGAATAAFRDGATGVRSRATFVDGGSTTGASAGATSV